MANEQNLMSIEEVNSRRTPEQHSRDSRKAGIASGNARRKKREMRDIAQLILGMPLTSKKATDIDEIKSFEKINGKNLTVQECAIIKQAQKALKGDQKALEFLRDTAGEKPREKLDISHNDESLKEMEHYFDNEETDS